MRKSVTIFVSLVVAAGLVGCGAVNKGTAFASEFAPLLEDRELLESSRVTGSNNLPWAGDATVYVELVPDLDDAEMAEEVWSITRLEVDNQIGYTLNVQFPSPAADGGTATAGFALRVPGPAPDDASLREDVRDRIGVARDLVALGSGETMMSPGRWSSRLETQADVFAMAQEICADEVLTESIDVWTISGRTPGGGVGRIELRDSVDCAWVGDVADLVVAAESIDLLEEAWADSSASDSAARLEISFVPPGPTDDAALDGLVRQGDESGVALTVV